MTADQLSKLLKARHSGDVFIPQCKMGSAGSRVLDGWALLPTWSPRTAIGYEIKVSRSDWLKDQKFDEYRGACDLFFVVAPRGIVLSTELPHGVGLLEPIGTGDGQRLVMRTKAARIEADPVKLCRLMAYALMWKRVGGDPDDDRGRRAEVWRKWAQDKDRLSIIGCSVRGRMRQILTEAIEASERAAREVEMLRDAAEALRELGIKPGYDRWDSMRRIKDALKDDEALLSKSLADARLAIQRVEMTIAAIADNRASA